MTLDNKRIGNAIRSVRKLRGMTQAELATAVGMAPNSVAMLERGERGYSVDNLNAFSKALRVPASCLTVLGSVEPTDELGRRLVERIQRLVTAAIRVGQESPKPSTSPKPRGVRRKSAS